MDQRVAEEAVRLMPSSLRSILQRHEHSLAAGTAAARGDESSAGHTFDPGQGAPSSADRLADLVDEAVAQIDGHAPFARVAETFGAIAHVVGDLNNPLQAAESDPREPDFAGRFDDYVERSLPRYRLVFYGWDDPLTQATNASVAAVAVRRAPRNAADSSRRALLALAERSARRARAQYGPISRAYDPKNPMPFERRFDVRSLPFGIGSLGWSHSVTDTARVWLHVWRRARGDLKGTPYLTTSLLQSRGGAPHEEKTR